MQAGLQGNGHRNLMCKDLYAALTCALDTGSRLGTIRNEAQPRELCTTTQAQMLLQMHFSLRRLNASNTNFGTRVLRRGSILNRMFWVRQWSVNTNDSSPY